ncbi:MAG: molybdopterin-dependent oxidoreductase [Planctomycetes bacterium]|nr:molybdopterin-dependent oxidoreductase [Planctomycetota bacterium]
MGTVTKRTACSRDCPDACGLLADIRSNEIVSVRGDPAHPVTRGFACFRTSRFPAIHAGPDRVNFPLVRAGESFERVAVEKALDLIAERLLRIREESGPASIFHYRSGGSLGLLKSFPDRFFEAFGPCTVKSGDICSGAGEQAQIADFGRCDSNDLFDLEASRHIVVWGKNPFVSNLHLVPILREARERGATVTLIDPVHHRGASLADEYVQPRPGRDTDLALGVCRELVDRGRASFDACENADGFRELLGRHTVAGFAARAEVDLGALRRLADRFADGPTAILVGWGMQRRRNGGAIVRTLDALSTISGNLTRPGGGCSFYFRRRGPFASLSTGAAARYVREPMFGQDVLAAKDPPIRAIWVTAGNPVAMLPDSAQVAAAFEQAEFVVVADPLMTDTASYADVVLPVPTMFEDDDLLGAFGHHWITESRRVVDPPPDVLHEVEWFQRLAERVGLGDRFAGSVDDWKRELLAPLAAHGVTLESLRERGQVRPPNVPLRTFADGIPTRSGKVELLDADAFVEPAEPDEGFPLWLFSNSTRDAQASVWSVDPGEYMTVTVHPEVAAAAGLAAGERARLESAKGSMTVVIALDAEQRRDVVIVPKGGHFRRGQSANALIEARPTDIGLGAAFLDCHVRLVGP